MRLGSLLERLGAVLRGPDASWRRLEAVLEGLGASGARSWRVLEAGKQVWQA